tara:strand:- start:446 stop:607 length:162 start_codon:yes stop_codon:yes gene_type:complete
MNIDLSNKQIALLLDLIEHRTFLLRSRIDNEKDPEEIANLESTHDKLIIHVKG